ACEKGANARGSTPTLAAGGDFFKKVLPRPKVLSGVALATARDHVAPRVQTEVGLVEWDQMILCGLAVPEALTAVTATPVEEALDLLPLPSCSAERRQAAELVVSLADFRQEGADGEVRDVRAAFGHYLCTLR